AMGELRTAVRTLALLDLEPAEVLSALDEIARVLGGHSEPRSAKELRDELLKKHPDRSPTPQVVRNTLESLVAKGRIRRHKRERSVMYTLAESGGPTAAESGSPADAG
ncbi:hypothetical protein ABT329_40715, partial [Streptomyces minutiscleroticus]